MSTHGGAGSTADAGAGAGSQSPDMSSRDVSAILKQFLEQPETPTEHGLWLAGLDGLGLDDVGPDASGETEHTHPDLAGAKLGSVLIERRLGEGGMGEVWLGHEEDLDIPVAVKVLPARYSLNQAAVLRFLREGRAVARLDHPNIVRVLQSGRREHAGVYLRVMVMEFVEGCDAYEALADCPGRRMDPVRAAEVALGAARALKHAHSRGVIHRDIKPSNLLLPSEGGVKVADFGLSQVAGTATQTGMRGTGAAGAQGNLTMAGMVMGTPAYMSPEQCRGLGADGRSDVYSLGITLYELLTGQPPFQAGDAMSMIRMHIEEPIPFEPRDLERVPPALRELIVGMCRKLPDDRTGTDEVIERLTAFLGRSATPGFTESAQTVIPPTRTNIPARDTSFVGREQDLGALDKLFGNGARLVTVMGPGGVGKTRLVQEFGLREATRRGQYPGGVWFCDLTEARNPESLAAATGRGLGMNLLQGEPVQQVHMALRMRGTSLVILDNFEQVAEHAQATVGIWLRDTPHVRFLVSSREPLHLEAERLFALDALGHASQRKTPHSGVRMTGRTTPGHTRPAGMEEPEIPPAVRLFADRASMASREFRLTAENAGLVGQICAELDGIPLAIELAAARVGSMSVRQLLERLPRRFELLTSRRRDASARQATMRGAIDWSWDLLEPWERLALAQCGVFIDGFLMEAAEKVIDLSAFPEAPFTLDVIESLVEKSLVRAQEHPGLPGETRYRMYESIRDYASRKMAEAGSAGPGESLRGLTGDAASAALRQRHAEYYAAYAGLWSRRIPTGASREAVERVGVELGNLFSAQDAMEAVHPVLSAKVAAAFRETLKIRGPWQPRVDRLARAVAAAEGEPGLKAELLVALALAHFDAGNRAGMETAATGAEALSRSLAAANPSAETLRAYGSAIGMMGQVASRTGNMDQALECYAKAEAVFRGIRDDALLAQNFGRRGQIHAMRGQSAVAIPMFQEAERISRRLGNGPGISAAVGNLGLLHSDAGEHARALGMFAEAEGIDRDQGNVLGVASWIGSRGNTLLAMGEGGAALECFTEAEQLCRELGARAAMTTWLSNRGLALNRVGRFREALEVFREAEAVNRQIGNLRSLSYNLLGRARALAGMAEAPGAARGDLLQQALGAVTECQGLRQQLGMQKSPMYFTSLAEHAAILGMLAAHAGVTTDAGAAKAREARSVADEAMALADALGLGRGHHEPEVRMAFAALDQVAQH